MIDFLWVRAYAVRLILTSVIVVAFGCSKGLPDVNSNSMYDGMKAEKMPADPSSHMAWADDGESKDGSGKNCKVEMQGDTTKMVYSDYNDWYLYLDEKAKVNCNKRGGAFEATFDMMTISVMVLTPMGDSEFTEAGVRQEMANRRAKKLQSKYRFNKSFSYKPIQLGDAMRPAMCAEVNFKEGNEDKRLLSCITSISNINGDILAHFVEMTIGEDSYEEELTFAQVATSSASWYRASDSDGAGNLLNVW